jgi:hypothetical protein
MLNFDDGFELELLDDRSFKFRLGLLNEDGKILRLRKAAIVNLVIEDNILDLCHHGHLTFRNPHDSLERQTAIHVGDESHPVETFRFRGDSRDILIFEMHPVLDGQLDQVSEFDSEYYSLKFTFTVYKIEDVPSSNPVKKAKKIYFRDRRVTQLMEKDIYWSSGPAAIRQNESRFVRPLSQLTDDQRAITTGGGIKDILEMSLDTPKFSKDWDPGSRRLFYTSPGGSKAVDDLYYMYNNHVSSSDTNLQPSILRNERYTNEWSLNPLGYYFDRACDPSDNTPGEYQNEVFYISNEVDDSGSESNKSKVPTAPSKTVVSNITMPDLSMITSYVYSEMPGEDNQTYIVSTPIHTYHTYNKQFNFQHRDQAIDQMFNYFKDNITNKLVGGTTGPFTDFFINNTKEENKNVRLLTSQYNDNVGPLISSRNSVMTRALYGGSAISFKMKGATNRRTGRFIAIDRNNPYEENDFDNKILGQYFVTKITHQISQAGYFNTILGSKPYYYNEVKFNHNIK